ncbi:MAG TPA: hypothetical protein IAB35_04540 [Candidatus Faecimonas gallistercoris]|nr:hypothetical protein [Candidatus Faecimonas gallistercoris]
MPGPKTHDIFYKNLKEKLDQKTLESFPNYDKYNIFVQGHDFLIYHDFYKKVSKKALDENVERSVQLQEHKFQEFVYNYLKNAEESGSLEQEDVRLFIGPGYVMHHLLDAYTHPQIIYYAGDHTKNPEYKTWYHGILENLLDIYMMDKYENKNAKNYKVYKDFEIDKSLISDELIKTIDDSLRSTYGIVGGGKIFDDAFLQLALFMRVMKYDKTGIKRVLFDAIDPITKGSKSFSYHRDYDGVLPSLNLNHEEWLNPTDGSIISTESFIDLYEKALDDGAYIVDELEKICQTGTIHKDDVYSIIPNISSVHGLECEREFQLKYTKKKTNNR